MNYCSNYNWIHVWYFINPAEVAIVKIASEVTLNRIQLKIYVTMLIFVKNLYKYTKSPIVIKLIQYTLSLSIKYKLKNI